MAFFFYCEAIILVLAHALAFVLALALVLKLETIIQNTFQFMKHLIDFFLAQNSLYLLSNQITEANLENSLLQF